MKVDLFEEFKSFSGIEFDDRIQKQDYVFQKLLEASSSVIRECLEWIDETLPDALGNGNFRDYLELALATKLVRDAENRAYTKVLMDKTLALK